MENISNSESKRLSVLAGVSVLLGIIWDNLFFDKGVGLNFPLFMVLGWTGWGILHFVYKKKFRKEDCYLAALSVFFAGMVFYRASELLTFFNVLASLLLGFLVFALRGVDRINMYIPKDYLKTFVMPFFFLAPFFGTFSKLIAFRSLAGNHKSYPEVIRGSIMAVIAVGFFAWLLSSADAVFEHYLRKFISFDIDPIVLPHTLFIIFVTAFCIGAFAFFFATSHQPNAAPLPRNRKMGVIEISILLGSITTLFLLFIAIQVTYLFGGEAHFASQGLTYAEYARKGFFELIIVSIFSFLIISQSAKQIALEHAKHFFIFRAMSSVLIIEVIIILASAFARLSLYEHAYGFSTIRLYSHALMIWLAVVSILLAYQINKGEEEQTFAFRAFMAVAALLLSMNILNPDLFIAQKNIERYKAGGELDTAYLASLSDDALPVTIQILDDPNDAVRNNFAHALYGYGARRNTHNTWVAIRWPYSKAQELINSKQYLLDANAE